MASHEKGRETQTALTRSDFVSLATARAGMYDFLAILCIKPSAQTVGSLMKRSVNLAGRTAPKALKEAMVGLQSSRPDLSSDGELALQVDWTRLFRGVAKGYSPPPPYESVYKEGLLGGPTSQAVARIYATNGLGLSDKSNEMPDYIGVEFKFMSTLASEESKAWGSDPSKAVKIIEDEKRFVQERMRQWIPRFCGEAKKLAKTEFYRSVADVIRSILDWDAQLIESIDETANSVVQRGASV
ncbi:MAG: molecular chaperone TorD family protein [Nitrososphaerota archaeon]|nr:molecular chaperone TorD family protein [Nitrososphaerota archaeon]MDG7023824.1 molecular chaperone TorD family protein [Nitrososphaerota archaeon]